MAAASTAKKIETPPADEPKAAAAAAIEAPKEVVAAPLLPNRIWARESGIKFNTWEVVPQPGVGPEQLLKPEFWGNVSAKMRAGDTILVLAGDSSWYAEFLIWDAGQNWAHVAPKGKLERPELPPVPGVNGEFEIGHDPIDGVVVKRKADGSKVRGNFPNAEDARRWIMDHQRALRK